MKEKLNSQEAGKNFNLSAVLGVTTGIVIKNFGEISDVLDYLVGVNLFTHQYPAAAEPATQHLFTIHPGLKSIVCDKAQMGDADYRNKFLAEQEKRFGKKLHLTPMSKKQVTSIKFKTLVEMMGKEQGE